jgi:hypothetical protein
MALRPAVLVIALIFAGSQAHGQAVKLKLVPQPTVAVSSEQRALTSQSKLGPQSRAFVAREGARLAAGGDASEATLRANITAANLGSLGNDDIEALMMLVLMQAAQDAQDDLRSVMEETKAANAQKQELRTKGAARGAPAVSNPPAGAILNRPMLKAAAQPAYTLDRPGRPPLQTQIDQLKPQLDSLSDLSDVEQLRLQQLMDRRQKLFETLSNLMKKFSDTQSAIVSNMK